MVTVLGARTWSTNRLVGVTSLEAEPATARGVSLARIVTGLLTIGILGYAYLEGAATNGLDAFNYFGYLTNQTSLLTSLILITIGAYSLSGRVVPVWLFTLRGVATACLLIVALVYNLLVPGTGSAPSWVSAALHFVFPAVVILDWVLIGDRPRLPWRRLWVVIPYPAVWLVVVLARGATDGWVPYGFLLPTRGLLSIGLHVLGLFGALVVTGALTWAASRFRGLQTP